MSRRTDNPESVAELSAVNLKNHNIFKLPIHKGLFLNFTTFEFYTSFYVLYSLYLCFLFSRFDEFLVPEFLPKKFIFLVQFCCSKKESIKFATKIPSRHFDALLKLWFIHPEPAGTSLVGRALFWSNSPVGGLIKEPLILQSKNELNVIRVRTIIWNLALENKKFIKLRNIGLDMRIL